MSKGKVQKLIQALSASAVAYNPELARIFGSPNAAILFQQIHYWMDKGSREDGFIYKTKKEIEEETALNRYQQDKARKKLEEIGVLEVEKKKVNGAPTLHYRIDYGKVEGQLMEKLTVNESMEKSTVDDSINREYQENTNKQKTLDSGESESNDQSEHEKIIEVIDAFRDWNPTAKSWYKNKTQRKAIKNMIEEYGLQNVLDVIDILPQTNDMKYVPTITTPHQLWKKWERLKSALKSKKKSKSEDNIAFV